MRTIYTLLAICLFSFVLASCATYAPSKNMSTQRMASNPPDYAARLPQRIATSEKVVVVNPHVHAWGAYSADGSLIKAGLATAGADWCPDLGRRCHTGVGTFRVNSLGSPNCKSTMFPIGRGGAPMPYCMFFNRNQALHGTPEGEVVEGNVSHGCVRMHVWDAQWLRYNFVNVGTKVVVTGY